MLVPATYAPETSEMSASNAADILGVSDKRVYALCASGALESRKVGNTVMGA